MSEQFAFFFAKKKYENQPDFPNQYHNNNNNERGLGQLKIWEVPWNSLSHITDFNWIQSDSWHFFH